MASSLGSDWPTLMFLEKKMKVYLWWTSTNHTSFPRFLNEGTGR